MAFGKVVDQSQFQFSAVLGLLRLLENPATFGKREDARFGLLEQDIDGLSLRSLDDRRLAPDLECQDVGAPLRFRDLGLGKPSDLPPGKLAGQIR